MTVNGGATIATATESQARCAGVSRRGLSTARLVYRQATKAHRGCQRGPSRGRSAATCPSSAANNSSTWSAGGCMPGRLWLLVLGVSVAQQAMTCAPLSDYQMPSSIKTLAAALTLPNFRLRSVSPRIARSVRLCTAASSHPSRPGQKPSAALGTRHPCCSNDTSVIWCGCHVTASGAAP